MFYQSCVGVAGGRWGQVFKTAILDCKLHTYFTSKTINLGLVNAVPIL